MRWSILAALLLAAQAAADHHRVELWLEPTLFYDTGDPIPPENLLEHRIYCDGDPVAIAVIPYPETRWESEVATFSPGTHSCVATAVDVALIEGVESNTVGFTVIGAVPAAPVLNVRFIPSGG